MNWKCLLAPLPLAVALTLLNAAKPLVIDDTAYWAFARQIARHPADPYGFRIIWYQHAQPAFEILAPPVLPYWLAAGMALLGDSPFLWKLWLFPFAWLFAGSLFALFRRFTPGLERPLLAMTVLSPAFLPSFNLMLDLPAAALTLGGLVCFLRAADRRRGGWGWVVLAGVLTGLAMQTKYTALLGPVVIGLYALFARRVGAGMVAALVAAALFAAWEAYLVRQYGDSHFLFHLRAQRYHPEGEAGGFAAELLRTLAEKVKFTGPMFGYLGGLAPAVGLLGMAALGAGGRWVWRAAGVILAGFALVAAVPERWSVWAADPGSGAHRLSLAATVMGVNSVIVAVPLAGVVGRLGGRGWSRGRVRLRRAWRAWFLTAWLGVEVAGYFALTPFPAARRVLGLVVVLTLLAGHLAARTCRSPDRRRLVHRIAAFGVGLGLFYGLIDGLDAVPEKRAAGWAAEFVRAQPGGGEVWFAGHWGFSFYAQREGMRPIWPGETVIPAGSWAVLPVRGVRPYGQSVAADPEALELRAVAAWRLPLGVRTIPDYYGGHTPLAHHEGPRVAVRVYRVIADWRPETSRD